MIAWCQGFAHRIRELFSSRTAEGIKFIGLILRRKTALLLGQMFLVSYCLRKELCIDCIIIDGPVDVTIWGDYLLVLDADSVAIFTPMGLVIKKCRITMNGQPVSLKKLGEMLIITR